MGLCRGATPVGTAPIPSPRSTKPPPTSSPNRWSYRNASRSTTPNHFYAFDPRRDRGSCKCKLRAHLFDGNPCPKLLALLVIAVVGLCDAYQQDDRRCYHPPGCCCCGCQMHRRGCYRVRHSGLGHLGHRCANAPSSFFQQRCRHVGQRKMAQCMNRPR
jgi:hypothetical protein